MNDGEIAILFSFIGTWYLNDAKQKGIVEMVSSWVVCTCCLFIAAFHMFKLISGK
jgi:hypothetical protein